MDQRTKAKSKPKAPTPSSWRPGQSGNPKGRPRAGLALAERIRERVSPDVIIDLALQLAADDDVSVERRLAGLLPFVQLGYLRPPTTLAATVTAAVDPTFDVTALQLDEQRKLLELIRRARAALPAGEDES